MNKCTNWCSDNSLATYCDDQCEVAHLKEKLAEAREEKASLIKWLDQEKQDWGSSKKDTWNPYCRVLSKLKEGEG